VAEETRITEALKTDGYTMDIVVPLHNRLDLTMRCLDSLYRHTHLPFHLIAVDDSTDLTPLYMTQFCKEHPNVTYIYSQVPFVCGNQIFNLALNRCKTPYLATVMNSIRVEPFWQEGLIQVMGNDATVGIVGGKCLLPNGFIESYGIKMVQYLPCDMARGEPGHRWALVMEMDAVQWAFALLRVEAVKGRLSENGFHGFRGWDDIDNSLTVKNAGWKVVACGATVGFHEPRATRGNDSEQAAKENRENGVLFYKHWGFWEDFVKQHGENGDIHARPQGINGLLKPYVEVTELMG